MADELKEAMLKRASTQWGMPWQSETFPVSAGYEKRENIKPVGDINMPTKFRFDPKTGK
jgi:hypothetical protein